MSWCLIPFQSIFSAWEITQYCVQIFKTAILRVTIICYVTNVLISSTVSNLLPFKRDSKEQWAKPGLWNRGVRSLTYKTGMCNLQNVWILSGQSFIFADLIQSQLISVNYILPKFNVFESSAGRMASIMGFDINIFAVQSSASKFAVDSLTE